jgi:hypothetical protein|tara:strand:- start:1875 stop:2213 length:339 start_codon:yes stop_codon:yes gene_type:complete
MANTFKSVTSGSIGTALTNIYTCPSSTTAIVLGTSMANISTNPVAGSIKLAKSGSSAGADDVFVVKSAPVPVGSSIEVMSGNKIVLEDSDIIQFQSDAAGSLDTILSILEIS